MIVKTDSIVLRTRKFRESSKIVTLYTREHGKMSVVARGVVRPKSKYGSALQPMAFLSTIVYRKEGRDLHNLSIAEPLERFNVLSSSLERLSAGMAIVEIVEAAMHDEDRNEPLFEALLAALRTLNDPQSSEQSVVLWFLIRLATILGYAIRTDDCGVCDEPIVRERLPVPYSISIGAPLCAEHREVGSYRTLSAPAFDLLCALSAANVTEAAVLRPEERSVTELGDALNAFIRFHVEGLRRLKVRGISAKVLDDIVPSA
ncbi:MAG: DNA repair protein RecO [Candidatus Kapaibacterium sp.]